jgi:hypothetical protein
MIIPFSITESTCVGCAPQYTYTYSVTSVSDGVTLLNTHQVRPNVGVMGGTKRTHFEFQWNTELNPENPLITIRKSDYLGKHTENQQFEYDPTTGQVVKL